MPERSENFSYGIDRTISSGPSRVLRNLLFSVSLMIQAACGGSNYRAPALVEKDAEAADGSTNATDDAKESEELQDAGFDAQNDGTDFVTAAEAIIAEPSTLDFGEARL